MNDKNKTLLDAEKELTGAIEKIKLSISGLNEMQEASKSLKDVAEKNIELSKGMLQSAEYVKLASGHLSEEGIAKFDKKLDSLNTKLDKLNSETASVMESSLKQMKTDLEHALVSKVEQVIEELEGRFVTLKLSVWAFGVIITGLLFYIGFVLK